MGRKWIGFLTATGVLAALLGVLLPLQGRFYRQQDLAKQVEAVEWQMAQIGPDRAQKHRNLAKWYNRNLTLIRPEANFRYAYQRIYDLGGGLLGILEIPELELKLPVSHGIGGFVGHDPDTPLPVGGRGDHTVLYLEADICWRQDMLLYIRLPGLEKAYRVASIQVMPEGWCVDCPCREEMLILVFDWGNTRTIVRCAAADAAICTESRVPEP